MAHEIDMSNGKANMAFVENEPWHGLGNKLEVGASIDAWKEAAGLDWSVMPSDLVYEDLLGIKTVYPYRKALVRTDTGKPLSIVSTKYKPVQPPQVLEFFRGLVEGVGSFTMETAGCLSEGKKIWALAKASDQIRLGDEDVINRYLLLATSYDSSIETIVQQTSVRVVCQNTLGMSVQAGDANRKGETRFTIKHTKAFEGDKVKQQMVLDEKWTAFATKVNLLAGKKVDHDVAVEYFMEVFYPAAIRNSDAFSKKAAQKKIEEMMRLSKEAPGQNLASADGTAWGLINAVTYYIDHEAKSRSGQAGRLEKAWFGEGATIKHRASIAAGKLIAV